MENTSLTQRLIWGGILILIGIIFLADNLFNVNLWPVVWRLWPLVVIGIGGWLLLVRRVNLVVGIAVLAFGVFLQLQALGIISINIFSLWPLVLIGLGVNMIFNRKSGNIEADNVENISETVVMGALKKKLTSSAFKYASLNAVFGAIEMDLRNLEGDQEVVIEMTPVFAAIELKLPDNAELVNEVNATLGAVEDHRKDATTGKNPRKFTLRGTVVLGAIEIH